MTVNRWIVVGLGLLWSSLSQASDINLAKQCLAYGQSLQEPTSQMQSILHQASIDETRVSLNRYSAKVGSQYIASELVASIRTQQENLGTVLCLLNNDKPLYFFYQPIEKDLTLLPIQEQNQNA